MIYLDNAATSFHKPKTVKDSVKFAIENYTANPGRSGHKFSLMVAEKIFETREKVKKFFNCNDYSFIFTKNCTEALNIAIFSTLKKGDHVITTCYEHNSVLRPLERLKKEGVEVTILNCDLNKFNENLEKEIRLNTKLVITTFVSNVTGEVCNVKAVGDICKRYKVLYLVDGAQACGHVQIDLTNLNIDMFTFAGHKGLLSLTGVGGLLVKDLSILRPILYGGTGTESENLIHPKDNEEDFEAGTLSSISILSLGAGIDFLNKNFNEITKKEQILSKYLYNSLKKLEFLEIYSKSTSQNVFSINVKNVDCVTIANILNERFGIAVRSGLHCSPLVHKKLNSNGAVRISLDFNNSFSEIDYLIFALNEIATLL